MKKKFELVLAYEGDDDGAIEFAKEVREQFDCSIVILEVDGNGDFTGRIVDWEQKANSRG